MITKSLPTFILLVLVATVYGRAPSKIYNGELCKPGDYGFIVSLSVNNKHICGGSIITAIHVLTAAHCVSGLTHLEVTNMRVRSHTINSQFGGQEHRVDRIMYHIGYNPADPASPNDMAVIKLTKPVLFDQSQKWIALASSPTGTGQHLTAIGWGYTESHPHSVSRILKKISLTSLESSRCQNFLKDKLWPSQICTASPKGYGLCNGDSGGPLIDDNNNLVGVVSWGIPCAHGNPDVFSNVFEFRSWIMDAINEK